MRKGPECALTADPDASLAESDRSTPTFRTVVRKLAKLMKVDASKERSC